MEHLAPLCVVEAPSNLGLRPPREGCAPGVYKLAGALRDQGITERLGARSGGVVTPPRYLPDWEEGRTRNEEALDRYSRRLAERLGTELEAGFFPVVLGGDCSILLGALLALSGRGRHGLLYLDGHSDFRHPGNSPTVKSAAGEDLALATGRGGPLARLSGAGPLVADSDVVVVGIRSNDLRLDELRTAGATVFTAAEVLSLGASQVAERALQKLTSPGLDGFWVHVDVDVLDPSVMPAMDTPTPGGLTLDQLRELLVQPLASPRARGMEVTIFDPDLDEDGSLAAALTETVVATFSQRHPK